MSNRTYPRIGAVGAKPKWRKNPQTAPYCIFPGCKCRATRQPWIEVSWFRGEDERSGPVCDEHSTDPSKMLQVTTQWKVGLAQQHAEALRKRYSTPGPL